MTIFLGKSLTLIPIPAKPLAKKSKRGGGRV